VDGTPRLIRTTVFDATERRTYEEELLKATKRAEEVATALQLGLLSGELPTAPEFSLGVAYKPGVSELEVGGDWYDAFWLAEGRRLGLAVGDVVGRGIKAAATMGQLRSAVRALASTKLEPGALVQAMDGFARRHEVGTMATLVYADLDLGTGTFRYASAGHPPPLATSPGEEPRFLWEGRSLPLDAGALGVSGAEQGSLVLAPDSRVLMFSDGLIERRHGSLPHDLERLAAEVTKHPDTEISTLTKLLAETLPDREHPDDVCLLTLQVGKSESSA
jgi:serine/threonine-protein kinase RsbW